MPKKSDTRKLEDGKLNTFTCFAILIVIHGNDNYQENVA